MNQALSLFKIYMQGDRDPWRVANLEALPGTAGGCAAYPISTRPDMHLTELSGLILTLSASKIDRYQREIIAASQEQGGPKDSSIKSKPAKNKVTVKSMAQ